MSGENPLDDAERMRLKRLAKLQAAPTPANSPVESSVPPPPPKPTPARIQPSIAPKRPSDILNDSYTKPKKKTPPKFNIDLWHHMTVGQIFNVTLDRNEAEQSDYDIVWLKHLAMELESEGLGKPGDIRLSEDITDRLLFARLDLNPQSMSDDLDYLPVLTSLPPQQTTFEYLVGCWKRSKMTRNSLIKQGHSPGDTQAAVNKLEKIQDLVISYLGLNLQEPEMFPQPSGRSLGPPELVASLLSLSTLSATPLSAPTSAPDVLAPSDVESLLQDLARRFEPDNEIDGILGPVVRELAFHPSLFRPEGLGGGDASWRGVAGGLKALVSIKSIAIMITRLEEWIPSMATAATFERQSLLGPLCRLGLFGREWPSIPQTYFTDPDKRSQADIQSSFASLRGTMMSLQDALFQIFNSLIRASPESREAVLQYFAKVISLNIKRAGMQVDPETVATDSFMLNLQSVMFHFAEPFMDANYTKIDRIDLQYYANSTRVDVKEETRINATSEEAAEWENQIRTSSSAPPNFISEIFYLTLAMSHYGYLRTIQSFNEYTKHTQELDRHLERLEGDGSWVNSPFRARTEAAINAVKAETAKIRSQLLSFQVALLEPEIVFRSIAFTTFLSTWLIRQVDPKKTHPSPPTNLPLPKEVPMAFRVLPEYVLEDIVDYLVFIVQIAPDSLEMPSRTELLHFVLTFLTSTWYIKNPFLKSKINDVLLFGVWYGRDKNGILGGLLNGHPMALKHLMPALMHFYIEVEQTGASSQFYDKFNARRNIAHVLGVVWNNPAHREALENEARNVDKFVRFVNLMINDVTYLMNESLSELAQIHDIQSEMENTAVWTSKHQEYRREREQILRQLEQHASGYTTLGSSTVALLKDFTAETKAPFMMPEIVDRLAAMLDYNLDALAGPKCQNLIVKEPEKLKFKPRVLLSDILQIFLNLSGEEDFVKAVAGDGRSYRKELFERAARIARNHAIKSSTDLDKLHQFVMKVEAAKATLEQEEELGEIPDEFLDPLMYTVMRNPVLLPTSRTVIDLSTIKSHLLSDSKDPFNRMPLTIEEVVPDLALKARIEKFLIDRRERSQGNDTGELEPAA